MELSLSIYTAVNDSVLPVKLLLWGGVFCFLVFLFRRKFQNSFHSSGLSIVSLSGLLSDLALGAWCI